LAADPALAWGTAFAVAIALLVLTRAVRHFLVLPGVFVAAVIAFYLGLWLTGLTMEGARTEGLLMMPIETGGGPWWPSLDLPCPPLIPHGATFLAMLVVVVVTIRLNAAGLELATQR